MKEHEDQTLFCAGPDGLPTSIEYIPEPGEGPLTDYEVNLMLKDKQIEALNTFVIELIRELYDAESQIGTEWPGADEDVMPNLKDRLHRLGDIIGVESEDLEKQVWEER